jgi:hypothetical protein
MVLACGAAVYAPFHVFLFAYAVLGPLHYLTEISWLHDRNYFTPRNAPRRWWLASVSLAIAVLAFGYISNDLLDRPVSPRFEIALVYLVFGVSAVAAFTRSRRIAIAIVAVLALILIPFGEYRSYALVAYFLVTIVHVLVFTGAFVLYGALKTRSRVALLSLLVFIACAVAAVLVPAHSIPPSESVRRLYLGFEQLNGELLRLFGLPKGIYDASGLGVMRLIAFAYLYHYLNWFSKTSVIKWHEVNRSRGSTIVGAWLAGELIYLYDFRTGFAVFYVLSMLHVLVEFPLNHQTFVGIFQSVSGVLPTRNRDRKGGPEKLQAMRQPSGSR